MRPKYQLRLAAAVVLGFVLTTGSPLAVQAGGEPADARIAPDLQALIEDADGGLVDVALVFAEQPAREAGERLRPAYYEQIEATEAPARGVLKRLMADFPRAERAGLTAAEQMQREARLLSAEEKRVLAESRDRTQALVRSMRRAILEDAQAPCDALQEPVVRYLLRLPGSKILARLRILNGLCVRLPADTLTDVLETFPAIAFADVSAVRSLSMDKSVGAIGAGSFTTNGYNGTGTKVAIVDTGVDSSHPALSKSDGTSLVTAQAVYLQNAAQLWWFNDNANSTDDFHGHGTHLSGTVASNHSTYGGVAPNTRLLNAKCFAQDTSGSGGGTDPDIYLASDWALTNGADVLNLSFGGGTSTTDGTSVISVFYDAVVQVARAHVAVAAGNSGPGSSTVGAPGDGYNGITVGAFDDKNTTSGTDDTIAGFSARGTTGDGRLKPDLTGPGVAITSARNTWEGSTNDFRTWQGTSMATPHVAGAMALLLDYNATWHPEAVKALLLNSTRNSSPVPTTPGNTWGYGAMDLGQAYANRANVASGTFQSSGADHAFYRAASLTSGDRFTLAWSRAATYSSQGRSLGGGSASAPVNLDIAIWDASDSTAAIASSSTTENVEQTKLTAALTSAVVKVVRTGSFPSGQTSVDYGLAGPVALQLAAPPDLAVTLGTLPTRIGPAQSFQLSATFSNQGDLPAYTASATLSLPAGFSVATGSTSADLGRLDPVDDGGNAVTVVWDVVSGSTTGVHDLAIESSGTAFGGTYPGSQVGGQVTVDATPPVADAGTGISVFATSSAGSDIELDGTASSDDSGLALTYTWDTDDDGDFEDQGGSATGAEPTVSFPLGLHRVTLRVADDVGNTDTDSVTVWVRDNPPEVIASVASATLDEGDPAFFDGSGSNDIESAVAHNWDFGDGQVGSGATPTHVYRQDGVYDVVLTVVDSADQPALTALTVTVRNVAPAAYAGADRAGVEGAAIVLTGAATDPGLDDVHTFAWDFGDGFTATGRTVAHTYAQDGSYTASLTVTDDAGDATTDVSEVTVDNVAPTLALPDGLVVDVGLALDLALEPRDVSPVDAAQLDVRWELRDAGDGLLASGSGTDVHWISDRKTDGTLLVAVSDDDTTVEQSRPVVSRTPSVGAGLGPLLALELDPKLEKKLTAQLFAIRKSLRTAGTSEKRMRGAARKVRKVLRLLAKAGVQDHPLVDRLRVQAEDLEAGTLPPQERAFVDDGKVADTATMLTALPTGGFDQRSEKRMAAALLGLRLADRIGKTRKIRRAVDKAFKMAQRLPVGTAATWYIRSLVNRRSLLVFEN